MEDTGKSGRFTIDEADNGQRLDKVMVGLLPTHSRSAIARFITTGAIILNGVQTKASATVRQNDVITWELPEPAPAKAIPQKMDLTILYEDDQIIVINKPSGIIVHPGAGVNDGTLVNGLLDHCHDLSGVGGELRPGIIHRLDKGTSGVLVVAKNDQAHNFLSAQFANRTTKKFYRALVIGKPPAGDGVFDTFYGRHPTQRTKFSSKVTSGKRAVTDYHLVHQYTGVADMQLQLHTGRTHQIRVHLADHGCPILGDDTYGPQKINHLPKNVQNLWKEAGHPLLHSCSLTIRHPVSNEEMTFTAPLPPDYLAILAQLEADNE